MNFRFWIYPIIIGFVIGGYYLGKKISVLFQFHHRYQKIGYWTAIYLLIILVLVYRLILVGWLFYAFLFYLIFDLLHWIFKKNNGEQLFNKIYQKGIPVLVASFFMMLYGIYNVGHPVIKEYHIKIESLKENMTIGMISDLHLGTVRGAKILKEVTEHANELDVQIFLLVGDIFDESTSEELKQTAYREFSKIKTQYGVYYVEGNHDLLTEKTKEGFEKNGISVLSDDVKLIDNQIYLIGRKDKRRDLLNMGRKSVKELLKTVSKEYPIILVDHQPVEQKEASKLGVNLHLSGHTHAGQIFPGNLFLPYGQKKKENYYSIVSSGYGAWGFSFRTAGRSEMVKIYLEK